MIWACVRRSASRPSDAGKFISGTTSEVAQMFIADTAKSLTFKAFPSGFGVFLLLLAAAVGFFWFGIVSLGEAWSTAEYSHGPLIPLLSLILFLKHLKDVPKANPSFGTQFPGLAVIAFALAIAGIGNIARIPDIITYGMIVWVYGVILVTFGFKQGAPFWGSVLHLVFMLPLPAFLYWQVSIALQGFSAELGVSLVRAMNVPVYLDGNIIDLGEYKLDVAEACSGLRYLFPIMSFSYIFCMLYKGSIIHKIILLLSAVPITILMNSARIGMIGILVDAYGIEQAEGFLHVFQGWVIFIVCILSLFALAKILQLTAGDRRPILVALELDFGMLSQQARRVLSMRSSTGLLAALMMTGLASGAVYFSPKPSGVDLQREPLFLFPTTIGGWDAGAPEKLEPNIEAVLKADDYLLVGYSSAEQPTSVNLFIAWYRKQTEGSGIHSPEVCVPAGGWEMSEIEVETVAVQLSSGTETLVPVNRAIIRKGLSKQLVYYWFEQRGRRLTSDYLSKAVTVVDAMTIGRTDGGLVRLVTPIASGENESDADGRLKSFMSEVLPILPQFVPQ